MYYNYSKFYEYTLDYQDISMDNVLRDVFYLTNKGNTRCSMGLNVPPQCPICQMLLLVLASTGHFYLTNINWKNVFSCV